jgi:hypothetical protein
LNKSMYSELIGGVLICVSVQFVAGLLGVPV